LLKYRNGSKDTPRQGGEQNVHPQKGVAFRYPLFDITDFEKSKFTIFKGALNQGNHSHQFDINQADGYFPCIPEINKDLIPVLSL